MGESQKSSNNKEAIVLMSGGIDSTTLLHYVKSQGYKVYGISFDYGQRHKKELEFAKYWGKKLCEEWKLIDLSFMSDVADMSALIDDSKSIPKEKYTHENQKITVVPNRNMVMLSIAIAWAENKGIKDVFFAPHHNDYAIYPDCRPEFVEAISKASQLGTYSNVRVNAPFVKMTKADIVKLGDNLGVDYSKTWSCYEGKEKHCGKCATCQERREAFMRAGVQDPTEYE